MNETYQSKMQEFTIRAIGNGGAKDTTLLQWGWLHANIHP